MADNLEQDVDTQEDSQLDEQVGQDDEIETEEDTQEEYDSDDTEEDSDDDVATDEIPRASEDSSKSVNNRFQKLESEVTGIADSIKNLVGYLQQSQNASHQQKTPAPTANPITLDSLPKDIESYSQAELAQLAMQKSNEMVTNGLNALSRQAGNALGQMWQRLQDQNDIVDLMLDGSVKKSDVMETFKVLNDRRQRSPGTTFLDAYKVYVGERNTVKNEKLQRQTQHQQKAAQHRKNKLRNQRPSSQTKVPAKKTRYSDLEEAINASLEELDVRR